MASLGILTLPPTGSQCQHRLHLLYLFQDLSQARNLK